MKPPRTYKSITHCCFLEILDNQISEASTACGFFGQLFRCSQIFFLARCHPLSHPISNYILSSNLKKLLVANRTLVELIFQFFITLGNHSQFPCLPTNQPHTFLSYHRQQSFSNFPSQIHKRLFNFTAFNPSISQGEIKYTSRL